MNNIPSKMKVITPLGDEEFSVEKKSDTELTLSIFKGSADLNIVFNDGDSLLAEGDLTIPFDCRLIFSLDSNGYVVKLEDPILEEVYIESKCEVI